MIKAGWIREVRSRTGHYQHHEIMDIGTAQLRADP